MSAEKRIIPWYRSRSAISSKRSLTVKRIITSSCPETFHVKVCQALQVHVQGSGIHWSTVQTVVIFPLKRMSLVFCQRLCIRKLWHGANLEFRNDADEKQEKNER